MRTRDADVLCTSTRVRIVRFSQAAVNDHLGGRTRRGRINAVALVICNEARIRAQRAPVLRERGGREGEGRSLGNGD